MDEQTPEDLLRHLLFAIKPTGPTVDQVGLHAATHAAIAECREMGEQIGLLRRRLRDARRYAHRLLVVAGPARRQAERVMAAIDGTPQPDADKPDGRSFADWCARQGVPVPVLPSNVQYAETIGGLFGPPRTRAEAGKQRGKARPVLEYEALYGRYLAECASAPAAAADLSGDREGGGA